MTHEEFSKKWLPYVQRFYLNYAPDKDEVIRDLHELGYDGVIVLTKPNRQVIVNLNTIHTSGLLYDYFEYKHPMLV